MAEEKNKPIKKFRAGTISVAVWKNDGTSKETGEAVEFNTITTDRRYTDKNGNWKSTNALKINDLPKMILLLQKAYEYLILKDRAGTSGDTGQNNVEEIVM